MRLIDLHKIGVKRLILNLLTGSFERNLILELGLLGQKYVLLVVLRDGFVYHGLSTNVLVKVLDFSVLFIGVKLETLFVI